MAKKLPNAWVARLLGLPGTTSFRAYLSIVRDAATRALGLRPFNEQLLGYCALLSGHAVEMDTGEGKTLVGALAAAGFAIAGRHAHVISVNDYLAERDATWMRPIFHRLGVSVDWIGNTPRSMIGASPMHAMSSTRR